MNKALQRTIFMMTGFFALFIGLFCFSLLETKPQKNTVCLSMIIKNESAIIEKCLASVKGLIDYWVIVDTGSTDGTQEIVKNFMKDIPGEFYERPWVNFAHNRNEALQLAKNKAEYSLFIDADESLVFTKEFVRPVFDKDVYGIVVEYGQTRGIRDFLVRNALDWQWKGVLHETLECPTKKTKEVLQGIINYSEVATGARAKNPKKHLDDALVLEKGLKEEPDNSRYQFYLAQCYTGAQEYPRAIQAYEKRIAMGEGSSDEYFYSLYMIGRLQERLEMSAQIVAESYKKAHAYRPWRIEPLFYMGCCYVREGADVLAYEAFKKAATTQPNEVDYFNVDKGIDWRLYHQLAGVCWRLGKAQETLRACEQLILYETLPREIKEEVTRDIIEIKGLLQKGVF